jgi:hypothetical protein
VEDSDTRIPVLRLERSMCLVFRYCGSTTTVKSAESLERRVPEGMCPPRSRGSARGIQLNGEDRIEGRAGGTDDSRRSRKEIPTKEETASLARRWADS